MGLLISCFSSVGACVILSIIYVASLYVWSSPHGRDHPTTIKRRFISVILMTLVSPRFVWYWLTDEDLERASLMEQMGLKFDGLIPAIIIPLLLTMILYLGPLSIHYISGMWKIYAEPMYWWNNFGDLIWLRNHIVAPLSEEFTFRACMMPILLQCLPPVTAIIVCPFIFGVAHFHHMIEKLQNGMDLMSTIQISCFQFLYTTLFGGYSAFLFARTGHLAAPLLAHAFCNHMGLPLFSDILQYPSKQRIIISALFVVGLVAWFFLLGPLTTPWLYRNTVHWPEA